MLFGWGVVDRYLGSREVSAYIQSRSQRVAERLRNPNVHAFALSADPDSPHIMVVKIDVQDKATFDLLDSDLDDVYGIIREPPRWDITVRSKEELGNDLGLAAHAMGSLAIGVWRLAIAAIAAIVVPATIGGIVLPVCRRFYSRRPLN